MESHRLKVTSAAIAHGRLLLRQCGEGFFPPQAFGSPSREDGVGKTITLHAVGLDEPVKTDLPTNPAGRPRWFFRDRSWLKRFLAVHDLAADDEVIITRLSDFKYRVSPVFRNIRFVDVFSGIGGTRLAFEAAGACCVFSSEWDRHAQHTYEVNFGDIPAGDITTIDAASIPDHEILVAGFPCQPFSIAGVSKKNALGREHGFRDESQGTLFFDLARIIDEKQPRAFMLENVKNLARHDKGHTFDVILGTLEDDLGYQITWKVINGKPVVPQNRERIFIIGSKPGLAFEFPTEKELARYHMASIVGDILDRKVPDKYTLTEHLWTYLQNYAEKHRKAGNGFGFGLVDRNDTTRTLSARYYKDGSEILIRQNGNPPRRLTPRECARLMGFPESFQIPVSDTQAYKQFGNSVIVPVVQSIAERLVNCFRHHKRGIAKNTQLQLVGSS